MMSRNTVRRKKKTVNRGSKKTVSKKLFEDALSFFNSKYSNDITRNAYLRNMKRYIDFCRSKYQVKSKDELKEHLQDYVDFLKIQGKTASSIHTYVAPCCSYLGVPMDEIDKPKRKVSENIRSRSRANKNLCSSQRYDNDKYSVVANFQAKVGIRRNELKQLRLNNFKQDESGYWCVEVMRGKGGKYQLQRILPEDVEFIKSYFKTPDSTERLFKDSDFGSNTDYHKLRALQTVRSYRYYYEQLHTGDPKTDAANAYRMRGELMKRWNKYNIDKKTGKPKRFPMADTFGIYKLRGDNRRFAITNGLSTEYSRLCLYMVSLFHLSHFRLSICMNYMLNV